MCVAIASKNRVPGNNNYDNSAIDNRDYVLYAVSIMYGDTPLASQYNF